MGGARRARRARATWAGVLLVAPALWGCAVASPLTPSDGGYRNARHGYWLGVPPAADPPWEPEPVEGALLAFRRSAGFAQRAGGERNPAGGVRMTFSSRCGEPITRPVLLARHLRIGIPANVVREAGPVELGGLAGWQQVFDADAARGAVRVKTVTFVANGCALDWVLIARNGDDFESAERDFDAWWHTLAVAPQSPPAATVSDGSPAETP
jgi:hypothetical protein